MASKRRTTTKRAAAKSVVGRTLLTGNVVVGVYENGWGPEARAARSSTLDSVRVQLRPLAGGPALEPSHAHLVGRSGEVFARFQSVPPGAYELVATRSSSETGALVVGGRRAIVVSTRRPWLRASVWMGPIDALCVVPRDPDTNVPIPGEKLERITLEPAPLAVLDEASHAFEVERGTVYRVVVTPKRGVYLETEVSLEASEGPQTQHVDLARRRTVFFVVIDSRLDESQLYHQPNIAGLRQAVSTFDPGLEVKVLVVDPELAASQGGEVMPDTAEALEARYHPFAIFGGGSWTEWFVYAADPTYRQLLDQYMDVIRTTDIPMFAVCGSHQLTAAAFHGWSALEHMSDTSARYPITEDQAPPPSLRVPSPRLGESGVYPIAVTEPGTVDPVVAESTAEGPVWAAIHHADLVIGWDIRFEHIFAADPGRVAYMELTTNSQISPSRRCDCQGLRYGGTALGAGSRLLYSVQFHPEVTGFGDCSVATDGGFGHRLLLAFLRRSQAWWDSDI